MADRLFDPGPRGPNRWALHPDKWVQRSDVVYHATDQPALPRKDRGPNLDPGYGNSSGMHFGDKETAFARAEIARAGVNYIHTARLNGPQFTPQNSGLGTKGIHAGKVWDDHSANYSEPTDQAVRAGKVVPYMNEYEGPKTTSYRALPEATRTWSEDVQATPSAHPALQHLAATGYNPTIRKYDVTNPVAKMDEYSHGPKEKQLFGADVVNGGKAISHHVNEDDAFVEMSQRNLGGGQFKAAGSGNVGVKRNNERPTLGGTSEAAKHARPTLRRGER